MSDTPCARRHPSHPPQLQHLPHPVRSPHVRVGRVPGVGPRVGRWEVGRPLPGDVGGRCNSGGSPGGEAGQATAEYALVLLGAAAVALLLIGWATTTDQISRLFDFVIEQVIGRSG